MAKPKAKTLQERFGFLDEDLKKPAHDDIMFWLNDNCSLVIEDLFGEKLNSKERYLEIINTETKKAVRFLDKNKESEKFKLIALKEELRNLPPTDLNQFRIKRKEEEILEISSRLAELESFSPMEHPPKLPIEIKSIAWEEPVISQNYKSTYTIGFVDLACTFGIQCLHVRGLERGGGKLEWINYINLYEVCFEVKTVIPSAGELIRQINLYRQHMPRALFCVVSPDDKYMGILKQQDIYFYQYPF